MKAILVMEMPGNCLECPCDDACGESCQVMDGIVEGKENMERLTYKTNGKYLNTTSEQAPPYAIDCDVDMAITKLAEYEDLEEQGKLLRLDFKYQKLMIGQEIFIVEDNTVKTKKICKINECWNDYHGFQGEYGAIPSKGFWAWQFEYDDFGKTVFLTREEAEAALKELEGKGE